MKVLVTGATGFVGSHTVKVLKQAGFHLQVLVRNFQKASQILADIGTEADAYFVGDITDAATVKKAVAGCDAVVHTAAMVSTSEKDAELVYKTNVEGSKLVVDCSLEAGVKKIIYVSSVTAMFNLGDKRITEDSPLSTAKSPYGRSKTLAESYMRQRQGEGAPIIITYPAAVAGSHDPNLSGPHFCIKLLVGICAFTSSTGMQFVNAHDIARAHLAILQKVNGPERFVLGGHFSSWHELVSICEKLTGRKLFAPAIPGALMRFFGACADVFIKTTGKELPFTSEGMVYATQWVYADSQKIEQQLGFKFTDKEKTLAQAIHWLYKTGHLNAKKAGLLAKDSLDNFVNR